MGYYDPPEEYEPLDHYEHIIELFDLNGDDPLSDEKTGRLKCEICPRKHRCRDSQITQARESEKESRYWQKELIRQKVQNWQYSRLIMRGLDDYSGYYLNSPEYRDWLKEEMEKVDEYINSGQADLEYDRYKDNRARI